MLTSRLIQFNLGVWLGGCLIVGCSNGFAQNSPVAGNASSEQIIRINAIIQSLDHAKIQGWSNPGGVHVQGAPELDELAKEGLAAVGPLLDAFENDKRLTGNQNISFRPNIAGASPQEPSYVPVHRFIWEALRQTEVFDNLIEHGQEPKIETMRAWWKKVQGKTLPEIWFTALQLKGDEGFGWGGAGEIVEPVNRTRGSRAFSIPYLNDQGQPMRGEVLRSKRNPSVTDLIEKRCQELIGRPLTSSDHLFEIQQALFLALDENRWDRAHSLPALKSACHAFVSVKWMAASLSEFAGETYAQAILARLDLNDPGAFQEYNSWIKNSNSSVEYLPMWRTSLIFIPLVVRKQQQEAIEIAQHLFLDANSPLNVAQMAKHDTQLLASPLLAIPSFRQSILLALDDQTLLGSVTRDNQMIRMPDGSGYAQATEDKLPPNGPKTDSTNYRVCDATANAFRFMKGTPLFKPYWTEQERNAAISKLKSFIKQQGDHMEQLLRWPQNWASTP